VGQLSKTQQTAAELAAEGMSNDDIGDVMRISQKAAGKLVHEAILILGASNRRGLRTVLLNPPPGKKAETAPAKAEEEFTIVVSRDFHESAFSDGAVSEDDPAFCD